MAMFQEITPDEAHRRLREFDAIDVRAEHEFRGPLGRIRGAKLVPLPELEARAEELRSSRPLLLVCRSGARSGKACERLAAIGIGPVVNLSGGMVAWHRAQLPVEGTDPASLGELLDLVASWLGQVASLTPAEAREKLRQGLERAGFSFEPPTHEGVDRALVQVEEALRRSGAPPDLDLSLASFRRWLAGL